MPVVDPRIAGKPVPRISKERMERECVARVKNVAALDVAFLDQRIPRYEPTHAVRRPSDQHGFVFNIHATKCRQNLVHVPRGLRLARIHRITH